MKPLAATLAVVVLACLALTLAGCSPSAQSSVVPNTRLGDTHAWRVTSVTPASHTGGEAVVWSADTLAWGESRSDEDERRFDLLDLRTHAVSTLFVGPPFTWDFGFVQLRGRYYWLRDAFKRVDPDDGTKDVQLRTELLSIAAGEASPTVMLARYEMHSLLGAGDRLVWVERQRGSKTRTTMTMRLSDTVPSQVKQVGGPSVDAVLTESMLAWSAPRDPTRIHVLPLDASGNFTVRPIEFTAGDSRSHKYQLGSLSADGTRLAWSARGNGNKWDVYSWSLGESEPRRLSQRSSGKPRGPIFSEQNDEDYLLDSTSPSGLMSPIVSGDRVSWRQWRDLEREVQTWRSGDSSPTVLARYSDPDYPTALCSSGDRVAWVVETSTDEADEASLHSIMTWRASEGRPQTAATGGGVDSEDAVFSLSVNADRLAFDGNFDGACESMFLIER